MIHSYDEHHTALKKNEVDQVVLIELSFRHIMGEKYRTVCIYLSKMKRSIHRPRCCVGLDSSWKDPHNAGDADCLGLGMVMKE